MNQIIRCLVLACSLSVCSFAHPADDSLHHRGLRFASDGLIFASGLQLQWEGCSPTCQLIGLPPEPGEAQRVLWQDVYLNADLTVITYSQSPMITYEWVVYPSGNPNDIVVRQHAATRGQPMPPPTFTQPQAWQDQGGITDVACPVQLQWVGQRLSLTVGDYDPGQALIIRWTQQP